MTIGIRLPLLIKLLEQEFDSAEMKSLLDEFLEKSGHCSKWVIIFMGRVTVTCPELLGGGK